MKDIALSRPVQSLVFIVLVSLLIHPIFFTNRTIVAYGEEPNSVAVIINEVEINPLSGDSRIWIELFNKGDAIVPLSNLRLTLIIGEKEAGNVTQILLGSESEHSTPMLSPEDHFVLPLQNIDHNDLIRLQLFRSDVLQDEVEGLKDNIADSQTWQRYPDGLDTGNFEDWIFAESTKGQDNGNLGKAIAQCYLNPTCMNLDTPGHQSTVLKINGTDFTISTFSTSRLSGLDLNQDGKKLIVHLEKSSKESKMSFLHVTFPKMLLSGEFLVHRDQSESPYPFFLLNNDTHSRLLIEYSAADTTIEIAATTVLPEFGSTSILLVTIPIIFGLIMGMRRYAAAR